MLRLIELFAGYGSQALALKYIGLPFEHYRVCEFDKYAIQTYNYLHDTNFKTSDITKISATYLNIIDTDKFDYLMTYSFPCTDLSIAGKMKGMAKGSGTRSGLLWEVERLLNECNELPQFLLMENVTEVCNDVNMKHFKLWLKFLESKGYTNYYKNLNSKDHGIPQSRKRTFMISKLDNINYNFPKKKKLELRLKDLLENNVDEKYYLSDKAIKGFSDMKNRSGLVRGKMFKPQNIHDAKIARTIDTRTGCVASSNYLLIGEATKQGYKKAYDGDYVNLQFPDSETRRGRVGNQISQTLLTNDSNGVVTKNLKIRKLTPNECFRIMGVRDEDFNKIQGIPNTQLYKQAGNSIVVDVLMELLRKLFIDLENEENQMTIFDYL